MVYTPKPVISDRNLRRIFVYGTLMTGGDEHTFGTIKGSMYTNGRYPFIIEGNDTIMGEVQDFTNNDEEEWLSTLALLDEYEGVEHNLYLRLPTMVTTSTGEVLAWVYIFVDEDSAKKMYHIVNGDWSWYKMQSGKEDN